MSIRFIGGYLALVAILLYVWSTYPEKNPLFAVLLFVPVGALIGLNIWVRSWQRKLAEKQQAPRPKSDEAPLRE